MRLAFTGITLAWLALVTPTGARTPVQRSDSRDLHVVSLNLAMREDVDAIAAELDAIGITRTADLVLLQEVVRRESGPDVASQLGQRLGLAAVYQEAFATGSGRRIGMALLTRYPRRSLRVLPLRRMDLSFRSRHRIAIGTMVETPAGPVHVYNVHLDTRINLKQRIDQLAALIDEVQALDGPIVVGGDFNTNDNRWLFHTIPLPFMGRQTSGLLQFMEGLGFRSVFERGQATHDALGMQLDWLFLRGLRATGGAIRPVKMSDHHALVASLVPGSPSAPDITLPPHP